MKLIMAIALFSAVWLVPSVGMASPIPIDQAIPYGVGLPAGSPPAQNSDGTYTYSYQFSDGAGLLSSFSVPDPGNIISSFSARPGVVLIPVDCQPDGTCLGIDYHQYEDTVGYVGEGGCGAGYSVGVCGGSLPGWVTWYFSHGGGAIYDTPAFGLVASGPPVAELGELVNGYNHYAIGVWGPAPTPEPASFALMGSTLGGFLMWRTSTGRRCSRRSTARPTFVLETGHAPTIVGSDVLVKGIDNILVYLKMIDGRLERYGTMTLIDRLVAVRGNRGGICHPRHEIPHVFAEGNCIGHIFDPAGNVVEEARAPLAGIAIKVATQRAVSTGTRLYALGIPYEA